MTAILKSPRNPAPTVDVVIELPEGIVLIERANPPPGWALPGGFVEYGESVEAAAVREALEETGLEVRLTELLGVYSDPRRDPRSHTIAVVFIGTAAGSPIAGDDAAKAAIYTAANLPTPLAFDHADILRDYFMFKRAGVRPPLRQNG